MDSIGTIIAIASQCDATDSFVLGNVEGKLPASPISISLDDPDTNLFFSTLLRTPSPCTSHSAFVGLLALPARQIQQLSDSTRKNSSENAMAATTGSSLQENDSKMVPLLNISRLYLTAVSMHIDSLIYSWNSFFLDASTTSSLSTIRLIVEIIKVRSGAFFIFHTRFFIVYHCILLLIH